MADVATNYDSKPINGAYPLDDRQTASALRQSKLRARQQRLSKVADKPAMTRAGTLTQRPLTSDANRFLNQPRIPDQSYAGVDADDDQALSSQPERPRQFSLQTGFVDDDSGSVTETDETDDYSELDDDEDESGDMSDLASSSTAKAGTLQTLKALKKTAKQHKDAQLGDNQKSASDKEGDLVDNTFGMLTDKLLAEAWINLIPSWGTTLLYIDGHVFLRFVLGEDYFCKLGHEWATYFGTKGGVKASASSKAESELATSQVAEIIEQAGDRVGLLEGMVLIIIHFLLAVIIFALIYLLTLMAYVANHPIESAIEIFGTIILIWYDVIF